MTTLIGDPEFPGDHTNIMLNAYVTSFDAANGDLSVNNNFITDNINLKNTGGGEGDGTLVTSASTSVNLQFKLPAVQGAAGQVLSNDGAGLLYWGTSGGAILPSKVVSFTVSGIYTPTVGCIRAMVFVQGGGGGGGGCSSTDTNSCGAGGGSGALATGIYIISTGTAAVVVGSGGAGVDSTAGGTGIAGEVSSFTYGASVISAAGGFGGGSRNSSSATPSDQYISVANLNAGEANIPTIDGVFAGGYERVGTVGCYGIMVAAHQGAGGNGGASEYGVGGGGAAAIASGVSTAGSAGTYGSGGGGAVQTSGDIVANKPGGSGGTGLVRIIEYF